MSQLINLSLKFSAGFLKINNSFQSEPENKAIEPKYTYMFKTVHTGMQIMTFKVCCGTRGVTAETMHFF
jgi:hypothetical protein